MNNLVARFWEWINEPSLYDKWDTSFKKLQSEKKKNGMSDEYWRIWNEELCPAYQKLIGATPEALRHPETEHILQDMNKPVSQRKYY